jgi:hypothetical protein
MELSTPLFAAEAGELVIAAGAHRRSGNLFSDGATRAITLRTEAP